MRRDRSVTFVPRRDLFSVCFFARVRALPARPRFLFPLSHQCSCSPNFFLRTVPHACVLQMKYISISALVERFKIGGSLARVALKHLTEKGLIRPVSCNHKQVVYTRATNTGDEEE